MEGSSSTDGDKNSSNILDEHWDCLAKRIRDERTSHGWSLSDLAERSGVSRAMIHRIETGVSSPTAALLGRLSGAFRISMSDLLRDRSQSDRSRLIRDGARTVWRDPETGYTREQISAPQGDAKAQTQGLEITRIVLPASTKVEFPSEAFEFISQAIWVTDGQLHFIEGKDVHQLGPGDCLTLGTPDRCVFENRSDQPCTYIVVIC